MGEGFCFLQSVSNYSCVNFQLRLILQEVYILNVCIFFITIKKKHHKIYWKEFKKFCVEGIKKPQNGVFLHFVETGC